MTLQQYLEHNQISTRAFARGCGLAEGTIRRVLSGEPPTLRNAITISDRTFGRVTLRELCPDADPDANEARA